MLICTWCFQLLCSTTPRDLKLTSIDDEIAEEFTQAFPRLCLDPVDENVLKSVEGKQLWRDFMTKFEKRVDDFNFGTLLRISCSAQYDSENTFLGLFRPFTHRGRENRAKTHVFAKNPAPPSPCKFAEVIHGKLARKCGLHVEKY